MIPALHREEESGAQGWYNARPPTRKVGGIRHDAYTFFSYRQTTR